MRREFEFFLLLLLVLSRKNKRPHVHEKITRNNVKFFLKKKKSFSPVNVLFKVEWESVLVHVFTEDFWIRMPVY